MNSNNIIVQEYLSSLKEDRELDYLFPLLLNIMGFTIVQTARESKGQSQYGKDIVAIGKDEKGNKYRWYFELKGYKDKDISDKNYSIADGIRESLIEAKDTAFNDSSIPGFNNLPIKIVLVHNGVLKTNIRPTFEGFINREFKNGQFERWDIYFLTDLFSQFLFSEYLLLDNESNRLFKKTLAFLDTPDYDYRDFKNLVKLQFDKINSIKSRAFKKLFATLGLLESLIFHYSKENDNLVPAKECSKYLIVSTWHWILTYNLEKRKAVLDKFKKLLNIQYDIFNLYFKKTFPIAKIENGLYAENGLFFEKIGYPVRCFDYLDDIIYFCRLRENYPHYNFPSKHISKIKNKQKDLIIGLIENNSGFYRPIMDNHSIPIIQLFLFFADDKYERRNEDVDFLAKYIMYIIINIEIEKYKYNRLPELHNDLYALAETISLNGKSENYCDSSSILIATLLELVVVLNSNDMFEKILTFIDEKLSLQIALINFEEHNVEQLLFEKHLHEEYHVECIERLPNSLKHLKVENDFEKFKEFVKNKIESLHEYRTDKAGFSFLRYLAHSYYKNEILPEEWRQYIK